MSLGDAGCASPVAGKVPLSPRFTTESATTPYRADPGSTDHGRLDSWTTIRLSDGVHPPMATTDQAFEAEAPVCFLHALQPKSKGGIRREGEPRRLRRARCPRRQRQGRSLLSPLAPWRGIGVIR